MQSTIDENILEHSGQVAQFAHCLALISKRIYGHDIDEGKVAVYALYHETSEVLTGDLPTPIKYYNSKINEAYKEIESIANDKMLTMLPEELQTDYQSILHIDKDSYEYKLVKAADKLSAYTKCLEELKCGNGEFISAKDKLYQSLVLFDMPEVTYFINHFVDGFSRTLDLLD